MAGEQKERQVYTIEDIARELGVSKTTVSRAISGKGRLSAETRARVLDFIAAHNYRPNAVAKSLAKSRSYNIGLVLPGDPDHIHLSFFTECMIGVCETAHENDHDVLVAINQEDSADHMRQIIDNRKVDGVIATRSQMDDPVISLLKAKDIPFAIIGESGDPEVLHVDNNNQEACRDLVSLLVSRGVRRMALLGGDENHCVTHSRLRGFEEACVQGGLELERQVISMDVSNSARAAAAIEQCRARQVECVVCMDDFICSLALIQMRQMGIDVPRDMKIASFYDSSLLEHTVPPVTSLRFDAVELGRTACRELLNLLEGKPARSRTLPGYQLILRDSTN